MEQISWQWMGSGIIIATCILVLGIGLLRNNIVWLLNFVLRGVIGVLLICVCNTWIEEQHLIGKVGLNVITLLTSAILGIPGVFGLYGIRFFINL